ADERLTRKIYGPIMNAPASHLRIADVVAQLLAELADKRYSQPIDPNWQIGYHTWIAPGPRLKPDVVNRWWKQAQAMGEEAYLLKHVIPPSGPGQYGPNDHLLHLIAVRYPQQLP